VSGVGASSSEEHLGVAGPSGAGPPLHAEEAHISSDLVARLLAAQFPRWAELPVEPVASVGTDHALYRLGAEMVVRLPRTRLASLQVEKEHRWLPELAAQLPLPIPAPLGKGATACGYPWPWSVYAWLDGETATLGRLADPCLAARQLGHFVAALHRVDPTGGPQPGEHNFSRGVPLGERDAATREAIAALGNAIDTVAITAAWQSALDAPAWERPPVWVHGDLSPANLLTKQGRLSAVIDFGGLGVGDPACDLIVGWNLFSGESRDAFREVSAADDATWARGRGWALSAALIALPYYLATRTVIVAGARRVIVEALADYRPVG